MTVLIMGKTDDAHAQHILHALEAKRITTVLFDTSLFPTKTTISWQPETSSGKLKIYNQPAILFDEIRSVYWRTINDPILPKGLNEYQAFVAQRDCMSTLRTFLNGSHAKWVNSWHAYQFHKEKPRQLALAKTLGVNVPASIISNSADDIIEFSKHTPKAIYKPVYGGAHTSYLTDELLNAKRLSTALSISPVTIQEFINGTNIRTYVIGNHTFSAEIKSNVADFREDLKAEITPLELPDAIKEQSLRIKEAFGMEWTAIDWRRNHNGAFYFLEANPSPMFIHFEKATGHPITEALINLIISP